MWHWWHLCRKHHRGRMYFSHSRFNLWGRHKVLKNHIKSQMLLWSSVEWLLNIREIIHFDATHCRVLLYASTATMITTEVIRNWKSLRHTGRFLLSSYLSLQITWPCDRPFSSHSLLNQQHAGISESKSRAVCKPPHTYCRPVRTCRELGEVVGDSRFVYLLLLPSNYSQSSIIAYTNNISHLAIGL
jgi:hypothetical protein